MIYTPRALLGFVQDAGFRVDQWGTALAVILACSAGDSLYRDVSWPGPSVDQRGLFGLDAIRLTQFADRDLFDPRTNCACAYLLAAPADNDWLWAGALIPPTTSISWLEAKAAVRLGREAQTLAQSGRGAALSAQQLETTRALAGVSDYVRNRVLNGGS